MTMPFNFLFGGLSKRSPLKRAIFFLGIDAILFVISFYLSFYLRFEGSIPEFHFKQFLICLPAFVGLKIIVYYFFQIHRFTWSYVGLYELLKIFKALTICSLMLSALVLFLAYEEFFRGFPRSIFIIDYVLSLIASGGFHISKRVVLQSQRDKGMRKKTLIIGAGNAGEQIVRDMKRTKDSSYLPVAFIDDDPGKKKVIIHGIKVKGGREDIPKVVSDLEVEVAVIAMPSVPSKEIRDIVSYLHKAGVKEINIIPGTKEILSRNISVLDIKKVDLKDLMSRGPIEIDYSEVQDGIRGKRVLITGAGGSIGSELARQIAHFKPELLILLDIDETALFYIHQELKERYPALALRVLLGDVEDRAKMNLSFKHYAPQIIFHTAAYKHVPILEDHPEEAVRVNIIGTKILGDLSSANGVDKFVFISTDKAVNPTSVMGVSKRVAEMVITHLNHQRRTQFIAVRFGNVLGSRGSVIPLFQEQIKKGGPVTITHPDMKRYFMTIPESVMLILQAATIGTGGEVLVLDMGEPVKIYDMACELIRLSGLEPNKDIPIIFTGIRPGEKLFEEVLMAEEGVELTSHPKIFKAKISKSLTEEQLNRMVGKLESFVKNQDKRSIIQTLRELVPNYQPEYNEINNK